MGERLRVFIRNYAGLKSTDPEKLRSFLDPLPMRVEMLSLDGGKDFIKTLTATESYHYSMLLYDIVKASIGVQSYPGEPLLHESSLQLQELSSQQIQPVNRLQNVSVMPNDVSRPPVVIGNHENSSVPNPFLFETLRIQSTPLQSDPLPIDATMRNQEMNSIPLQSTSILQVSRDVSLFGNVPEIPQQSTPLQAGSFPLPPLPVDRSPIVSIPIVRRNVHSPSLPVLREHEAESHVSARSPVHSREQQQVVHFIPRQRIPTDRREPDQLFQSLDVPGLAKNREFLLEMAEMTVDHRNEREGIRRQSRRIRLPEMRTVRTALPPLVIKRAEQVTCYDKYLMPTFHARRNNLETFLELATASIDLQQNVYYRVSTSVDEMRRDQSSDNTPSFTRPVQANEVLTSTDRMIPIEVIPEVSNEEQPQIVLSPPPQPIMVPDFVEHLIDTEPIRSPIHLRPRHETPRNLMISRNTGPSRRRRRRGRITDEQNPIESSPTQQLQPAQPTLTDFIQPEPVAFTAQSPLGIRRQSQVRFSRSRRTFVDLQNNDFRKKFQIWLHAFSKKTTSGACGHINRLAEIRKIEDLYRETGAVMRAISTEKFTPLQTIIPSSVVRTVAVKRITILLELNTRGLIKLKTNANRITTGVENTAIANIPVTD